jgi:hypothetical protein
MISPVIAAAVATSGEARYTESSSIPERPSKLRLNVRTDTESEAGTWPTPMQAPQVASEKFTPAAISSATHPSRASISEACLEPGATIMSVVRLVDRPSSIFAAGRISSYAPFVQEPMITWSTSVPATSSTGTTLSGIDGSAISGSIDERSTEMESW